MGIHSFWHLYATEPFIETETFMLYYGIATFPKIEMLFPVLMETEIIYYDVLLIIQLCLLELFSSIYLITLQL